MLEDGSLLFFVIHYLLIYHQILYCAFYWKCRNITNVKGCKKGDNPNQKEFLREESIRIESKAIKRKPNTRHGSACLCFNTPEIETGDYRFKVTLHSNIVTPRVENSNKTKLTRMHRSKIIENTANELG